MKLIKIREAARILGVSIDTLRRWDRSGALRSVRSSSHGHRYYKEDDLRVFMKIKDLFSTAKEWCVTNFGTEPDIENYCQNSAIFQTKLAVLDTDLSSVLKLQSIAHLLVAITGEIGNNSFDHNLGNWPDTPGIFFGFDVNRKVIVLADRGRGIFSTLKRVKPELNSHLEALNVAFTERITGREPESRGNGLKFVRKVVSENPIDLVFQTGDALLTMEGGGYDIKIVESADFVHGCLALIKF